MNLKKRATHERTVSVWGALAIGIGGMVGGGIFAVLGLAATAAGGATPLAFAITGGVALLTAYSYAKLSVAFPSAGGTVNFIDKVFGVDVVSGTLNNLLWLSYLVTLALYTVAFANYSMALFSIESAVTRHLLISAGILVPAVLNLASPALISRTEMYVVGIKLGILLLVVAVGVRGMDAARMAPSTWGSWLPTLGASMMMFVAYEGFELIANASSDVKDYRKNLPRAYFGSVGLVVVLYVLIAAVSIGTLDAQQIATAQDFVLAKAAEPSLGHVGFTLVAVAAVLATFSAINATIYGSARLAYMIAEEGELPEHLERKVWNKPVPGLVVTTLMALLLANTVDLGSISTMASAGFLLIFALVNVANVVMAHKTGANRFVSGLGALVCVAALAVLVIKAWQEDPIEVWVLAAVVVVIAGLEWVLIRIHESRASAGR